MNFAGLVQTDLRIVAVMVLFFFSIEPKFIATCLCTLFLPFFGNSTGNLKKRAKIAGFSDFAWDCLGIKTPLSHITCGVQAIVHDNRTIKAFMASIIKKGHWFNIFIFAPIRHVLPDLELNGNTSV